MDSQTLTYMFGASQKILTANLAGITHDESLQAPHGAANCINWLAGHILNTRSRLAGLLGAGGPFILQPEASYYGRGSQPIRPGDPCANLEKLTEGLRDSSALLDAKFRSLTECELLREIDAKMFAIKPEKPTITAILSFLICHEMYHSGQIGTLRRLIGKPSGIGV
jgi:hypothetical protein